LTAWEGEEQGGRGEVRRGDSHLHTAQHGRGAGERVRAGEDGPPELLPHQLAAESTVARDHGEWRARDAHTNTHAHTHIHVHTCICMCTHTHVCAHIHACIHMFRHAPVHTHIQRGREITCERVTRARHSACCGNLYMHTYIHTYICRERDILAASTRDSSMRGDRGARIETGR
jgi:hypothetical protein